MYKKIHVALNESNDTISLLTWCGSIVEKSFYGQQERKPDKKKSRNRKKYVAYNARKKEVVEQNRPTWWTRTVEYDQKRFLLTSTSRQGIKVLRVI